LEGWAETLLETIRSHAYFNIYGKNTLRKVWKAVKERDMDLTRQFKEAYDKLVPVNEILLGGSENSISESIGGDDEIKMIKSLQCMLESKVINARVSEVLRVFNANTTSRSAAKEGKFHIRELLKGLMVKSDNNRPCRKRKAENDLQTEEGNESD
jgi:hypothetical protein